MQRRNKVGGILDRRFGENDPTMTPEEKMLQRFALEKQRNYKKSSAFDLEDDEPMDGLTHMGRSLAFDEGEAVVDDFDESDLPSGDESDSSQAERKRLKRMRLEAMGGEVGDPESEGPERKKTKKEVMEEVIAKSKHHKYERQAAKDEDDDLRAEIDKELPDLRALLYRREAAQAGNGKGDQGERSLIAGIDKSTMEKDYDLRLRQMIQDRRAQPSMRTKTEEEKAEEESTRLRELEEKRLRRMEGQQDSDEEDEESGDDKKETGASAATSAKAVDGDEDDEFGLGRGIKMRATATELGFDDEDDFIIDDDLVASGSDLDIDEDDESASDAEEEESESDDEFTKGLLTETESKHVLFQGPGKAHGDDEDGVPYTFPCPQTHAEMLEVFKAVNISKLPTAVQRIRALYHPKLDSRNKEKLGNFSRALVHHISYLAETPEPQFSVLEGLVRHAHSLAKSFPIEVAKEYRARIEEMGRDRPLSPNVGDLIILKAAATTFPTSDHFHQVITPAMLSIARYLGQKVPERLADYATGTYLSILALEYQKLSKRYVPELMNFCLNTLYSLAPEKPADRLGFFPIHEPPSRIRIRNGQKAPLRKLAFRDCQPGDALPPADAESLKLSILSATTAVLKAAAETWSGKPAFYETFQPALAILQHLATPACHRHLNPAVQASTTQSSAYLSRALRLAHVSRRPLELHHHRPLAVRASIPKFEDSFDPGKHYDPDRERAELAKLRAEHRRERKGAMRELRKDANFLARENLRAKKERDDAYERKYRRLVAEIQSQEGKASNDYDRERDARKRASKRG